MSDQLLAGLRRMTEIVNASPPVPRCIIARHDVPWGKGYRMWDTRGELVLYVHRGWLYDYAWRRPAPDDRLTRRAGREMALAPALSGIPVVHEP